MQDTITNSNTGTNTNTITNTNYNTITHNNSNTKTKANEYTITNTHTDTNTNTHYNAIPNSITYIQWITVLLGFVLLGIFYYCIIISILFFLAQAQQELKRFSEAQASR